MSLEAGKMFSNIIYCVGIVLITTRSCFAYIETSNGTGGVSCGNHLCAPGATCTTNLTCVCDTAPFDSGNGYIKCLSSLYHSTFILNDPILETYDGDHGNLLMPCRYDITEIANNFFSDSNKLSGQCGLHVRAFNAKNKGKFYVHGVDAAVRVLFNTGVLFKMSVRKYGTAENGTYTYHVNATDGLFNVDGPFENDTISYSDPTTGLSIVECSIDKENNLGIINITHCGICIYFRPYDVVLKRNQSHIPGLGIGIDKANVPLFVDNGISLALIPKDSVDAIAMSDIPPVNASNTVKLLYRAFLGNITQNNPDPNPWCENATVTYSNANTTTATKAFDGCLWMMRSPIFIRCYDTTTNGKNIMELFDTCSNIFIGDVNCADVQNKINSTGCNTYDSKNTKLQKFMNGDYC